MPSRAKRAIAQGRPILAVNPGGVAPPVVDMLAACGVDALFIDCERTAVSIESALVLTRLAQARGMDALLRSPTKDPAMLTRYFDCGINGLILPQVETLEECAVLLAAARAVTKGHEDQLLLIAQIESVAGHDALDALAKAPGIDLFLVGPNDLAHSMGFLGDTSQPPLVEAVRDITSRLAAAGRPYGLPVNAANAAHWVAHGCTFLYATLDSLLRPGVAALRASAALDVN